MLKEVESPAPTGINLAADCLGAPDEIKVVGVLVIVHVMTHTSLVARRRAS